MGAAIKPETPGTFVHRIIIRGSVAVENWSELFRSFVAPGTRLNLKRLRLGVDFELEFPDGSHIDATVKAMKEAARQLGLTLEIHDA